MLALARTDRHLYVCGSFTNAGGGIAARNIARWDGTHWEALGLGVGTETSPGISRALAMAARGDDFFVGGIFETAGPWDAGYFARWNDRISFGAAVELRMVEPRVLPDGTFQFRATTTGPASYVLEHSVDFTTWTPFATKLAPNVMIAAPAPSAGRGFNRMRSKP